MNDTIASTGVTSVVTKDKVIRYSLFFIVMGIYTLPFLGVNVPAPAMFTNAENGAITLLFIHEFAGFIFFGHTFFSNVWAMRVRMVGDAETALMARAMLRKMAMGITGPTSIIVPLAGLMLVNSYFGGFLNNPWAVDAYICFWLMAALQLVPDIIRYAVDTHAASPKRDVKQAAIRGILSTFLTIYIIWCMVTKSALIAPLVLPLFTGS